MDERGGMATVRDVAERVGVSVSTVSRALSMPHLVNAKTRARVVAAAEELGYQPNQTARGLRSGVTGNIGLVIPDIENPYFAAMTKGVQDRARKAGYSVFIADSDEDVELEEEVIASIVKQVDGILLASPRASAERILELVGSKPAVILNRAIEGMPSLLLDNAAGVVQVLDHLQALGHRKIAYAASPMSSWSGTERIEEMRRQAELRDGLEIVFLGNFQPFVSGGYQAADLAVASGATALFAYNDLVAIGALERLRHRDIDVPGRMSVVGFDDVAFAELTFPTLTTVAIPLRTMGRRGVDALTRLVAGDSRDLDAARASVELQIRQSTAPPPHLGTPTP
jgi:LacI family transcriptional regulator